MGRREKSENMSEKRLRLRRGRRMGRRGVSCFVHVRRAWFRVSCENVIQNVWFHGFVFVFIMYLFFLGLASNKSSRVSGAS